MSNKLFLVLLSFCVVFAIDHAAIAEFVFVDLRPYSNHDGVRENTKNYINLPRSEVLFSARNNTPFIIRENEDQMIFTVISGGYMFGFPEDVTISIQDYAATVHFFGQIHWGQPNDLVIGRYIINYSDGTSSFIEINTNPHTIQWNSDDHCCNWRRKDLPQASLAWEDVNQTEKRALFREFVWVNPNPEKLISTISFVSYETSVNPVLCAITYDTSLTTSGVVEGLKYFAVECSNLTSGQVVTIPWQNFRTWDCEAAGLPVSKGDRVEIVLKGRAN